MIPSKIIEISDKVMVSYKELVPLIKGNGIRQQYKEVEVIAEVENGLNGYFYIEKIGYLLKLNQSCFIEPTTEGKCKIIRL